MPATKIILNVCGGVVQDVHCSDPAAEIVLVDWDIPPVGGDEPGVVSFPDGERTAQAYVGDLEPEPLAALAGTDIERALVAAGHSPSIAATRP